MDQTNGVENASIVAATNDATALLVRALESPAAEPGLPEKPPFELAELGPVVIEDGEGDVLESLVRRLVEAGSDIEEARDLADVAAANETRRRKRGRKRKGPRLWMRNGVIWIKDGQHRESTGFIPRVGEDYRYHLGALRKLAVCVDDRVRRILGRLLKKDITIAQVFAEWRRLHRPGTGSRPLDDVRFGAIDNHLRQFEEFGGQTTLVKIPSTVGNQYTTFRCTQQIRSQGKNARQIRKAKRESAIDHVESVTMVLDWYTDEHGISRVRIKRPKSDRHPVKTLTWDQLWRLLRAAKGDKFDLQGRFIGRHHEAERLAPCVRFILLYLYPGLRHSNILFLKWGKARDAGHLDPKRLVIERQGDDEIITNKRRFGSNLTGSLKTLVPKWAAADATARGGSPRRFTHVIHDEDGKSLVRKGKNPHHAGWVMKRLWARLRDYAGLPWATPHHLKATGVSMCCMAGMPVTRIMLEYSTSWNTLWTRYIHLQPYLMQSRPFDEADLRLLRLRKFSPASIESIDG